MQPQEKSRFPMKNMLLLIALMGVAFLIGNLIHPLPLLGAQEQVIQYLPQDKKFQLAESLPLKPDSPAVSSISVNYIFKGEINQVDIVDTDAGQQYAIVLRAENGSILPQTLYVNPTDNVVVQERDSTGGTTTITLDILQKGDTVEITSVQDVKTSETHTSSVVRLK